MEQDIWTRQEEERNAFFKEHNKAFQQLQADEQIVRKLFGFSDARMPDEWKDKLQRERQAWSNEWGVQGWRAAEMQGRHELEQKAEQARELKSRHIFTVPPFMNDEFDKCDPQGQQKLINLGNEYQDEKATFLQTIYLEKVKFQEDWNRLMNERKTLTVQEALRPLQDKYKEKAQEIAKQYDLEAPLVDDELQRLKNSFFANRNSINGEGRRKGMRF